MIDELKGRALIVNQILKNEYPHAKCSLDYTNALELLISTIMAAQCTDERVNIVTKSLFKKYRTVEEFAFADINELEEYIRPTGFYKNKAKNITGCCKKIITDYRGSIPDNMDDLVSLPGVGRKTANVVLGNIFNKPGIIVDTHCRRLSRRIGFTENEDPVKIEFDLMKIVLEQEWTKFSNRLVFHGRSVCLARKPKCEICKIDMYCDFYCNYVKSL